MVAMTTNVSPFCSLAYMPENAIQMYMVAKDFIAEIYSYWFFRIFSSWLIMAVTARELMSDFNLIHIFSCDDHYRSLSLGAHVQQGIL